MYQLRQYQKQAVGEAVDFILSKKDAKKGIIVAPTGSGKSLIISGIVNELVSPVIVLQPSKELLQQNFEKYTSYGNEASIFSASLNTKEIGHITFATIGSVKKFAAEFRRRGIRVVLVDECHIGGSGSGMMNTFIKALGDVKIIGLTATPVILMNTMMGPMLKMLNRTRKSFYNHFIHITQIADIIDQGFWTPLIYKQINIKEEKLKFNASRSEFSEESQELIYKENDVDGIIIREIISNTDRQSILIFVPSVSTALELAAKIPGAEPVWGNMDGRKREYIIEKFKNKEIRVVVNVNVLAIGFDHPQLDWVIDASPTASFARYYQKLGRVCRPHPFKLNGLITDVSGNYKRFGELRDVTFEKYGELGWGMFSGNRLLTNVLLDGSTPTYKQPIEENKEIIFTFGRYKDKPITEASPSYLNWLMTDFQWQNKHSDIKREVERILNV